MLVTLKEILKIAEEKKIAIGAFNTPNFTSVRAVIAAAEELRQPVILMHAQVHEDMGICKMEEMTPVMRAFAQGAGVPVCVHLDHGTSLDYIRRGIDLGFTSVMYDGSALPLAENISNTITAISYAGKTGASVEAEVGSMGTAEGGGDPSIYTDPAMAEEFVKRTGVDALACAFGTVHGFYKSAPKLDFQRLSMVRERTGVPVVMHGGSGVSHDDYRRVIQCGVRKINYYTYMSKAGAAAVSGKEYAQFHDVLLDAERAMRADVIAAISVFSGLNA